MTRPERPFYRPVPTSEMGPDLRRDREGGNIANFRFTTLDHDPIGSKHPALPCIRVSPLRSRAGCTPAIEALFPFQAMLLWTGIDHAAIFVMQRRAYFLSQN